MNTHPKESSFTHRMGMVARWGITSWFLSGRLFNFGVQLPTEGFWLRPSLYCEAISFVRSWDTQAKSKSYQIGIFEADLVKIAIDI